MNILPFTPPNTLNNTTEQYHPNHCRTQQNRNFQEKTSGKEGDHPHELTILEIDTGEQVLIF